MKRVILMLLVAAQLLIGSAAADTYMRPVYVGEVQGQRQLGGQAFVTELNGGTEANVEVFVVVENTSGSSRKFIDDYVAYGIDDDPMGIETLFARDPVSVRNREIVLYSRSFPIDLKGEKASELVFGAGCGMEPSEYGVSTARYLEVEIKDANTPGAKKMSVRTKDIQKGNYTCIFLVYDQNGTIVFADSEIFNSDQQTIISAYIGEREVAAIEAAGSHLNNAVAILYTRPNK